MKSVSEQIEVLRRGAVDLHTLEDLKAKLETGKPLRVKLGVDPTSPELHLGHTVALTKLRQFQDLGHVAVLILGDYTGRVGDPSGRDKTRPVTTDADLRRNAETYWDQASKVLKPKLTSDLNNTDPEKTIVVYNSSWLDPFVKNPSAADGLFGALSSMTVSRLLEREDFKTRLEAGHPLTMLEFLYPVFQGYDSVAVRSDVELGGTDQLFNLMVGRDLQRKYGTTLAERPQVAMTLPLLVGTDGVKKMSKSYANHIALKDSPKDLFGKTMSVSDEAMVTYYELLFGEEPAKVKAMHPMEAKKELGRRLTARFHGEDAGAKARADFESQFSKKELPADIPEYVAPRAGMNISEIIVDSKLAPSKKEAQRLIEQKAVKLNDAVLTEFRAVPELAREGSILRVGSRRLVKLFPPKP